MNAAREIYQSDVDYKLALELLSEAEAEAQLIEDNKTRLSWLESIANRKKWMKWENELGSAFDTGQKWRDQGTTGGTHPTRTSPWFLITYYDCLAPDTPPMPSTSDSLPGVSSITARV
jgi:hypothetical protein